LHELDTQDKKEYKDIKPHPSLTIYLKRILEYLAEMPDIHIDYLLKVM